MNGGKKTVEALLIRYDMMTKCRIKQREESKMLTVFPPGDDMLGDALPGTFNMSKNKGSWGSGFKWTWCDSKFHFTLNTLPFITTFQVSESTYNTMPGWGITAMPSRIPTSAEFLNQLKRHQ